MPSSCSQPCLRYLTYIPQQCKGLGRHIAAPVQKEARSHLPWAVKMCHQCVKKVPSFAILTKPHGATSTGPAWQKMGGLRLEKDSWNAF